MLQLLKALADPTRLRILGILAHGEFTVQELTAILAMGQSRISRHLRILTEAGIASVKRQGTWGYYRLDKGGRLFDDLWRNLEQHLDSLAEWPKDRDNLMSALEERRCRSQRFFDQHATQWDQLARELLPVADYRNQLLQQVPRCHTLLELGGGTGSMLPALANKADRILAVDHSAAMLAEARKYAERQALKNIDFRLGEMSHLPLGDAEVNWAVLDMVLHHAPRPALVLHELSRVLNSHGGVTIADLQRHEQEWVRTRLADQWLGFDIAEMENWFIEAGFEKPEFHYVSAIGQKHDVLLCTARKRVVE
ncbi:ArsR family transcriptional regulator [Syntrophotalea acetylenivorans]|uniref:ArsR family transcriptional regulator n=1 Tax=Syntrophotalea acetylenivorans TaxID=1842532 RepID=A0A1L3GLR8_9BACT|nr:metalloregulator ArsR/SmtB family transcription factor [Syntrophotalea acetylenivorans]APG26618.1 ArsR family transcriptional regulator [Syntrophotalea acetylenivorans]